MTRLAAALVAAALLLPAGARAGGSQFLSSDLPTITGATMPTTKRCPDDPNWLCVPGFMPPGVGGDLRIKIPPSDHSWHLLTISNGGTVSLIKGLTKRECDEVKAAIPLNCNALTCTSVPSDIKSAECFQ